MRPLRMAIAAAALVVALSPVVVRAQAPGEGAPVDQSWRLDVSWVLGPYPRPLYPQFVLGDLTWDGCSPLYLTKGVRHGCPVFRDEPVILQASVRFDGGTLLAVYPRRSQWVNAWIENRKGARRRLAVQVTAVDGSDAPIEAIPIVIGDRRTESSGAPAVPEPQSEGQSSPAPQPPQLRFRIDLAPVIAALPAGPVRICAELELITQPEVPVSGARLECQPLVVYEADSRRTRAERLRRRAIDLLAAFSCDEAAPVVDELLQVHPASASGFRLRGIIAELRQQNAAAIADYSKVVGLLRGGGDRLLPTTGYDFAESARTIASWRDSMRVVLDYMPEMSMLGPPEDRPSCRSGPDP
jgi:hypothetical protein